MEYSNLKKAYNCYLVKYSLPEVFVICQLADIVIGGLVIQVLPKGQCEEVENPSFSNDPTQPKWKPLQGSMYVVYLPHPVEDIEVLVYGLFLIRELVRNSVPLPITSSRILRVKSEAKNLVKQAVKNFHYRY